MTHVRQSTATTVQFSCCVGQVRGSLTFLLEGVTMVGALAVYPACVIPAGRNW